MGRDFYDTGAKMQEATWGLEVLPGYKTSVRQHEHQLLMCAEISHKVSKAGERQVISSFIECTLYCKEKPFRLFFTQWCQNSTLSNSKDFFFILSPNGDRSGTTG